MKARPGRLGRGPDDGRWRERVVSRASIVDRISRRACLGGLAALAAAVAACAPAAAPPTSAPAAAKPAGDKAPVQVRLSVRQAAEGTKTEAGIAAFEKGNPDIKIKKSEEHTSEL